MPVKKKANNSKEKWAKHMNNSQKRMAKWPTERVSNPLVIREVQLKIKVTKKHHDTPTRPVKTEKKHSLCACWSGEPRSPQGLRVAWQSDHT